MAFVTMDADMSLKLCIVHRHARPYMHDLGFYFKYLIRGIGYFQIVQGMDQNI